MNQARSSFDLIPPTTVTTSIGDRSASLTTFTPPKADSPGDGSGGVPARGAQSLTRRLLERFALIALGLYHIPLFLNNYPSLGGGGFNDDGLAVRWGHVFTPPGVWVARHVFHMTGPMPTAYQGDNGDVGEEFGRLLLAVGIAVVGAVLWTAADRKRPRAQWVEGVLRLLLRYSIALGLVGYALAKILPVQFPPLDAIAFETRVGDLTPMGLLWRFMQYSRPYSLFGGVMELVAVLLLCFRRTATLGALVCLVVMTNVAALNYAYDVQVKLYATMMVVSAAVLVLYDARRLLALFVSNRPAPSAELSHQWQDRLGAPLRWTIKVALVGSVIASSVIAMTSTVGRDSAGSSGVDGAWVVTSFARDGHSLDSTGNSARWRRLVVDRNGVAIRMESDSLVRCRRAASPDPAMITLSCSGKRQGQLRWARTGDALQLGGAFAGAPLTAAARRVNPSDYALLRRRFHWIYDR